MKKWQRLAIAIVLLGSIVPTNVKANQEQVLTLEDSQTGNQLFQFNYLGDWQTSSGYNVFSNGDEHYVFANESEAPRFEMKFVGHKVEIYGSKAPDHGIYKMSVDGREIDVDAYASERQHQQLLGTIDGLTEGEHTLVVEVTGRKNEQATNNSGQIDFAKVYHNGIVATGISLASNSTQYEVGDSEQIRTTLTPAYADNTVLEWSSNNPNVISVDQNGTIIAKQVGAATITAKIANTNIQQSLELNVVENLKKYQSFITTSNYHYFQKDYAFWKDYQQSKYDDIAWKGDRLTASIVVTTNNKELSNLNATISDFVNEKGDIIGGSNAKINAIKEVDAYIGRGGVHGYIPTGSREKAPDIIHSALPIDVAANKVQTLWLTLDVPKTAASGKYKGEIKLSADNDENVETLTYEFEVVNLQQPELKNNQSFDFKMDLWQYPYTTARYYNIPESEYFGEKHFNILKQQLKKLKEIGGDSITTTIVEDPWNHQTTDRYPSMIKWTQKTDGTFEFDFTHFDKYVELAMELGVNKQIKSFSMIPWENRIMYYNESTNAMSEERLTPGSQRWKEIWNAFLTQYVKHLEEKGWFDITYIAMDERPLNVMQHVIDIIKQHPNSKGKTLKIHGAMNYNAVSAEILDQIHDISIDLAHINGNSDELKLLAERRRKLGLTTTIYTCVGDYPSSFALSDPGESAWTMWYAQSQGVDGFMRWAFDAWVRDPLNDISHWYWESGDPFFVYPQETDPMNKTPYSSPRFEKLKEGMRDVTKARYLKSIAPELSSEIDDLIASIQRPYGSVNELGAKVAGSSDNRYTVSSEVERLRRGLNEIAKKYAESIKPNKELLQAKIDELINLDATLYEEHSFNEFSKVLLEAKHILNDENVTQLQVDNSLSALIKAHNELRLKENNNNNQPETPKPVDPVKPIKPEIPNNQSSNQQSKETDIKNNVSENSTVAKKDVDTSEVSMMNFGILGLLSGISLLKILKSKKEVE